MREGKFISQNVNRWKSYLADTNDPDEQAEKFIHLVDDLSYAKSYYPNSKTTQFINGLAAREFQKIYQHKKQDHSRLITFWRYEMPLLFYRYQKIYLFTFLFFVLSVTAGVLSSMKDPRFVRTILGDGYVEMTEENIQKGDPFGVYKEGMSIPMFIQIASNNIRVAFLTYTLGMLGGAGSMYLLFTNGLMLGTFQHMFFEKGLGWKSILVVWIHGTLEISSIVIAGTAGIILGFGFLFPGTYSRKQSLINSAKDSVKIVFGLIPFFIVAAFFESFITRHTEMPEALSISILLLSALVILWYFILYPRLLNRSGLRIVQGKPVYPNQS